MLLRKYHCIKNKPLFAFGSKVVHKERKIERVHAHNIGVANF
jgi:hypothetical protein